MSWESEEIHESRERIQRELLKRRARGESLLPQEAPQGGRKLCQTFWGQAWCRNLESYQHYEARLPRGRSYLRQGKVLDLNVTPGIISAVVTGSELYDTRVLIRPLDSERWQHILRASQGQVSSLLDLLSGKLGDGLMKILTDPDNGLFPKPEEIRFDCTCPDHADLCKHASAVLYGVGVRLDAQPELLFTLRAVDQADLLAAASAQSAASLGNSAGSLEGVDLAGLFGIELGK